MRSFIAVIVLCTLAGPASGYTIDTQHFASPTEVNDYVTGGYDFFTRGDTEQVRVTVPPDSGTEPFGLWNNGVAHAFRVSYYPDGIVGMSIDDQFEVQMPVTIDPDTNGLLVTAVAQGGAGRSVTVDNLILTDAAWNWYLIEDAAVAPGDDYLLVETDLPLTEPFILSGTVTFAWEGEIAPSSEQWFEVTPVVVPEPACGLLLMVTASLGMFRRRR